MREEMPNKLINKKKVNVKLNELSGKNELWTNSEIVTKLSIVYMELSTEEDVKIVQKFNKENLELFPNIPKSNNYTDLTEYVQF
jgi:hypothetical protein